MPTPAGDATHQHPLAEQSPPGPARTTATHRKPDKRSRAWALVAVGLAVAVASGGIGAAAALVVQPLSASASR